MVMWVLMRRFLLSRSGHTPVWFDASPAYFDAMSFPQKRAVNSLIFRFLWGHYDWVITGRKKRQRADCFWVDKCARRVVFAYGHSVSIFWLFAIEYDASIRLIRQYRWITWGPAAALYFFAFCSENAAPIMNAFFTVPASHWLIRALTLRAGFIDVLHFYE